MRCRSIIRKPLGAVGVTGTSAANRLAREADLVIAIGTRLSDFTTASKTAFARSESVRFINHQRAELDALKHAALPLVADARASLEELQAALAGWRVSASYASKRVSSKREWEQEVDRIYTCTMVRRSARAR